MKKKLELLFFCLSLLWVFSNLQGQPEIPDWALEEEVSPISVINASQGAQIKGEAGKALLPLAEAIPKDATIYLSKGGFVSLMAYGKPHLLEGKRKFNLAKVFPQSNPKAPPPESEVVMVEVRGDDEQLPSDNSPFLVMASATTTVPKGSGPKGSGSANIGIVKPIYNLAPWGIRNHGSTITLTWQTARGNEPFIIEITEGYDGPVQKKFESATTLLTLNASEFMQQKTYHWRVISKKDANTDSDWSLFSLEPTATMEAELTEASTADNFAQFDEITRILLEASALKSKGWNNEAKIRFNQLLVRYPSHPTLLQAAKTFNSRY